MPDDITKTTTKMMLTINRKEPPLRVEKYPSGAPCKNLLASETVRELYWAVVHSRGCMFRRQRHGSLT